MALELFKPFVSVVMGLPSFNAKILFVESIKRRASAWASAERGK